MRRMVLVLAVAGMTGVTAAMLAHLPSHGTDEQSAVMTGATPAGWSIGAPAPEPVLLGCQAALGAAVVTWLVLRAREGRS